MLGNLALWWQSRHNGIVLWIRLSAGSPLTWLHFERTVWAAAVGALAPVDGEHARPTGAGGPQVLLVRLTPWELRGSSLHSARR